MKQQWKKLPFGFIKFCLINGLEIKDTIEQLLLLYRGQSLYFNPKKRKRNLNQTETLQSFKNAFSAGLLNIADISKNPRQMAFLAKLKKQYVYKGNFNNKITQQELNAAIAWFMDSFLKSA